jgi:predicted DNA-binding protein
MRKPTTLRLPDELLEEVDRQARRAGLRRGAYLRHLIREGLQRENTVALLAEYEAGRLSAGQVCLALKLSAWEFSDLLRAHNIRRNVTFEDWLDSADL